MANQKQIQFDTEASIKVLCKVARLSNVLAKKLTGPAQTLAYRIKAEACSSLLLAGRADMNGVWPGDIVALNVLGNPPSRIHIRRSHLTRQAREIVDRAAGSVPAVSRLGDSVDIQRRTDDE